MIDANWYELNVLGISTEKSYITQYTMDYLFDNQYSEGDVIHILQSIKKPIIKYQDLPNRLWSGVLKRDTYYFHPELQILSKPSKLSISAGSIVVKDNKFFKEMRINYSVNNILDYFYSKANPLFFKDLKRDTGAIEYLLNRYANQLMEPVDIVLYLIDDQAHNVTNIPQLTNNEMVTLEKVNNLFYDVHRSGLDKIVYRWQ